MILANVAAAEELESRQHRLHVPGARLARPGKTRGAARFPRRDRHSRPDARQGTGGAAGIVQPHPGARGARPRKLRLSTSWCCAPRRRRYTARNNIGHFGLALPRYAHFTSPIRRYADLLVHRALAGDARPAREAGEALGGIGEHISATERRAAAAERARSTATARPCSAAISARCSRRGSPASPASACSSRCPIAAPTG